MKMTVSKSLDQIIEDPRKTKAVLKWLGDHGMLDDTMVAMWEIEQNNKEFTKCNHTYSDGTDATYDAVGLTGCRICGASDHPGKI